MPEVKALQLCIAFLCASLCTCAAWHSQPDHTPLRLLQGWLSGKGGTDASTICDVRDVARAHILAAETPTASGRYIVSQESSMSPSFVSETLKVRIFSI